MDSSASSFAEYAFCASSLYAWAVTGHRAIDTIPAGASPVLVSQMWIFLGDARDLEWPGDVISLGGREGFVVALHPSRSGLEVVAVDFGLVVEGGGGASTRVQEGEDARGVG
jgi:hypothetical protein